MSRQTIETGQEELRALPIGGIIAQNRSHGSSDDNGATRTDDLSELAQGSIASLDEQQFFIRLFGIQECPCLQVSRPAHPSARRRERRDQSLGYLPTPRGQPPDGYSMRATNGNTPRQVRQARRQARSVERGFSSLLAPGPVSNRRQLQKAPIRSSDSSDATDVKERIKNECCDKNGLAMPENHTMHGNDVTRAFFSWPVPTTEPGTVRSIPAQRVWKSRGPRKREQNSYRPTSRRLPAYLRFPT